MADSRCTDAAPVRHLLVFCMEPFLWPPEGEGLSTTMGLAHHLFSNRPPRAMNDSRRLTLRPAQSAPTPPSTFWAAFCRGGAALPVTHPGTRRGTKSVSV